MTHQRYRLVALLLVATLVANPAAATTHLSAEPIPTGDVIGEANLAKLESIGFTQIDFAGSATNNSMLFLRPAVTKQQFISGLSTAASLTPDATYVTLNNRGNPTTAKAGVAFPENDWIGFPNGDQYLSQIGNLSPELVAALAALRQQHLRAVSDLIRAIDRQNVNGYLDHQFRCR